MKFLYIFNKRELNGELYARNNSHINLATVIYSKMRGKKPNFSLDFTVIEGNSAVTPSEYTSVPFPVLTDNIATKVHSTIIRITVTQSSKDTLVVLQISIQYWVLLLKSSNKNTESKRVITLRKLHQMYVQTAWNNRLWKFLKKKSKKANS